MLTQTRIGVGSITFHGRRPMKGQRMSSICPNPEICIHHYFRYLIFSFNWNDSILIVRQIHLIYSVTISNSSAFYFFEINVLISLEGTPTHIRIGVGSITFHAKASMKGQYVLFMPKSWTFSMYFIKILFSATQPLISLKWEWLLFW